MSDHKLNKLILLKSSLQARIVPVFDLVTCAMWQMLRNLAPACTVFQKIGHDDEILLVREGLLGPWLELEDVPVAALLVCSAREVVSHPGPLLTSHGLCAHHEELVFLLGPADFALLFIAFIWVVIALLLFLLEPSCNHEWTIELILQYFLLIQIACKFLFYSVPRVFNHDTILVV